jgi:hypothetical protein
MPQITAHSTQLDATRNSQLATGIIASSGSADNANSKHHPQSTAHLVLRKEKRAALVVEWWWWWCVVW